MEILIELAVITLLLAVAFAAGQLSREPEITLKNQSIQILAEVIQKLRLRG